MLISILVAPHVGAWIEILKDNTLELKKIGRTSRRCVDWNKDMSIIISTPCVAPHVGAWIEISNLSAQIMKASGRTSRRCVDWNFKF